MTEENAYVPVDKLTNFMVEAQMAMGTPREDAEIIADVLITADLWGIKSHGVAHLRMYNQRIKKGLQLPVTNWTVVKDSPTTAVIDGDNGDNNMPMTPSKRKIPKTPNTPNTQKTKNKFINFSITPLPVSNPPNSLMCAKSLPTFKSHRIWGVLLL